MNTHTEGPWHVSSTHMGAARDIGAANGANIALISGPAENGADEFKANARLIAAAPRMPQALKEAADLIQHLDGGDQASPTGWDSDETQMVEALRVELERTV